MTEHHIAAGFMPLMDSAILVVAREKGFAAAQGVDFTLVRETSWANIRDRIAVGHFDVAHMLGPMPVAAALGLTPISASIITPFALGFGGNAVTVGTALWQEMVDAGAPDTLDPAAVGAALAKVVQAGTRKLRFAVVHGYSAQNYELRYWLSACGIRPGIDVDIVVIPPPLMTDALTAGGIDGYCVGEPWNSTSVASGVGHIATVKALIWSASPEKVLGVSEKWANANPQALAALLRALDGAAAWCGDPANHAEAAAVLSAPRYLNLPQEIVLRGLSGRLEPARGLATQVRDFFIPHAGGANVPWPGHALWFYSQMVRWGDVAYTAGSAAYAAASYRPDLYRAAISGAPGSDDRAPQSFFDGRSFDPAQLEAYLRQQA